METDRESIKKQIKENTTGNWRSIYNKNKSFFDSSFPDVSSYQEKLWLFSNETTPPKCPKCDNYRKFYKASVGYRITCGNSVCYTQLTKEGTEKTLKNTLGVSHAFQLKNTIKNTCLSKYGVDHPSKNKETRLKAKTAYIERFGVDHPSKSEKIKEKTKLTCIEKYGVDHPSKSKEFQEEIKSKWEEYTGFSHFHTYNKYQRIKSLWQEFDRFDQFGNLICIDHPSGSEYTITYNTLSHRLLLGEDPSLIRNPLIIENSKPANEVLSWLKSITDEEIVLNYRKEIDKKEIDIFFPRLRIGIEFNGIYWHTERTKSKDYHQNKKVSCMRSGIKLISIWEDDWNYKTDVVKSIILNALRINQNRVYARKCDIREVDFREYTEFVEKNHIQGKERQSKIRLGLYFDDRLIFCMSFGNYRKNLGRDKQEGEWELLRMCSTRQISVIGGPSRLFSHFIKTYNPVKIISYANLDYFEGGVYENLGMKNLRLTQPGYWWVVNGVRRNRFEFRKDVLVKMGFDPTKTEVQIMESCGHRRIFNCGNLLFEWSM